MSVIYPPGQISRLGERLARANTQPHITYVAPDNSKFYLSGPLAPVPGAQSGVSVEKVKGLVAPFKHITNQGARQDGATWQDAIYDAGEIDMVCHLSGMDATDKRRVIRHWLSAWNPKERGRLHVFTPEKGEWWASVRPYKTFSDELSDLGSSNNQIFTWTAMNDDAFWTSFDDNAAMSVDQFVNWNVDDFNRVTVFPNPIGSNWTQVGYGSGGSGYMTCNNGYVQWNDSTSSRWRIVQRYDGGLCKTDYHLTALRIKDNEEFPIGAEQSTDLWVRMNNSGTPATGVQARIGHFNVEIYTWSSGTATKQAGTLHNGPSANDFYEFQAGTDNSVNEFVIRKNGKQLLSWTDTSAVAPIGASYRRTGFGMEATARIGGQNTPAKIEQWQGGDNTTLRHVVNGFLPLTNRGDQDAWPRFLCYGPGTFYFGDGPGTDSLDEPITFGPLGDGQIVLVTTHPRLRSVIDLSPSIPTNQSTEWNDMLLAMQKFAQNSNTPPFLQQYESAFGVLPPQGNMYALLNGRFTKPLPGKKDTEPVNVSNIPIAISGGFPGTKVVAAVTPMSKWPM